MVTVTSIRFYWIYGGDFGLTMASKSIQSKVILIGRLFGLIIGKFGRFETMIRITLRKL